MKLYLALFVLATFAVGVRSNFYNLMTTSSGNPVDNDKNSLTAGAYGPILLSDFNLLDKLSSIARERIPERVVHAKGSGAYGYFEVTDDITKYCKANLFGRVGRKTPVFARFSTVAGEAGSADTVRDIRGFAVKFYTKEGNWDLVGNNSPVFFIRDPIKFADLVHSQKRNPRTHLHDANAVWDFFSQTPESAMAVTWLHTDKGTSDGYRGMDGYGCHTFKTVNAKGNVYYVKWQWRPINDTDPLSAAKAQELSGTNPDYAQEDLYNHLEAGGTAEWNLFIQAMPEKDAATYKWNILDITKVWPEADYPFIPIGKMVLNQNPDNYFAHVEQAAFSPSHLVPGIEVTNDKLLQGRLFAYPDTQRHRLGVNYKQIPVNCPYRVRVANGQRDGFMSVLGNQGSATNFEPSNYASYAPDAKFAESTYAIPATTVGRFDQKHPNSDYAQPGALYRLLEDDERTALIANIASHMSGIDYDIQIRQIKIFYRCDPQYGEQVATALNIDIHSIAGLTYDPKDLEVVLVENDI